LALVFSVLAVPAWAQESVAEKVRRYADAHRAAIIAEYLKLLALPNIHGDASALKRNAALLRSMMQKRGLETELWDTSKGAPVVFAQKRVPGATRTMLFYIHYDGQPVDPKRWAQADPFVPVIRTASMEAGGTVVADLAGATYPDDWRIYARASGDDRAPIEAILCAMDAIGTPKQNVKVILDGEEEGGGPGLPEVIAKFPDKLKSDLLVMLDGPQHPSGRPTIYYGARGGVALNVTVFTAKQGMHSGNYGNWMPDANVRLAQLIAAMVGPTGKVAIPGFYGEVLPFPPAARAMIDAVPDQSPQMQKEFGVGSLDGAASSLDEALNMPSFSVHDMKGGEVGGVIPASASAQIEVRLVKDNDPQAMVERITAFVRAQGYFITERNPDIATLASHARVAKVVRGARNGAAWRTEPSDPQAAFATEALRAVWGNRLVRLRTFGGSVPAAAFIDAYKVPTIGVAIANYDDNQHTDNENVRIGNIFDGMITLAALMTH